MSGFLRIHSERNIDAPGQNVDAISDVTIVKDGTLRVWISLTTASIVNLMLNPLVGAEFATPLNANASVDGGHVFDYPVIKGDIANVQIETDGPIQYLILDLVRDETT